MKSEDLDNLVKNNNFTEDCNIRATEELTDMGVYKENYPNHHKYWKKLVSELQAFGGNTIANFFRGDGVKYKDSFSY